jgi:hypothetical protein
MKAFKIRRWIMLALVASWLVFSILTTWALI